MMPLLVCGFVYAQRLVTGNSPAYEHMKDSIVEHYYPGMYDLSHIGKPLVPTDFGFSYRSPLMTNYTRDDSIKYVVHVFFHGDNTPGMMPEVGKDYDGAVGKVIVEIRDVTFPTIKEYGYHSTDLKIKRLKKKYKFKVVTYVRCHTPQYPKRETKRITTYVYYNPYLPGMTSMSQKVEHLPYSKKAKYGGACTKEDVEKRSAKVAKEKEKSKAYWERKFILNREKFKAWERKGNRKIKREMRKMKQGAQ